MPKRIMETAEPFFFKGNDIGCLLIHGFTGTPKEMRYLGEFLNQKGYTVLGIRLSGHATKPEDMKRMKWIDWAASVEDGINLLNSCCSKIVTIGLSMGGVLSLHAASNYDLNAAIAISAPFEMPSDWRLPFLNILSPFKPFIKKGESDMQDKQQLEIHADYRVYPTKSIIELKKLINHTRSVLQDITIPIQLIHSKADKGIPIENVNKIFQQISSTNKKKIILENSGHVITEDIEKEKAFDNIFNFIKEYVG